MAHRARTKPRDTEVQARQLLAIYRRLDHTYGPQGWWPASDRFEIIVGAVLVQNTNWRNVERAIEQLKARDLCSVSAILTAPEAALAEAIRSSGYYNVKARRLRAVAQWLQSVGGFEKLARLETNQIRGSLLGVHGVGPETCDDILLYALGRPVFVIDAYTKRVFSRLFELPYSEDYETWRARFETALSPDADMFNQFHALIVRHGKYVCKKSHPACVSCVLRDDCNAQAPATAGSDFGAEPA